MFKSLPDLRDALLAARLVREEILGQPVLPESAARLRESFLRDNSPPGARRAVEAAVERGRRPGFGIIDANNLAALAEALGSPDVRTHGGVPFHGKPAPSPARVPELVEELLDTVNAPTAIESWPAPVRAFGVHFLLRLVQPYQAPPDLVGYAAEAMLLAADGFAADHVLLAEPEVGAGAGTTKPDPDAFARERLDRLLERCGAARDRVRGAAARSLLAAWAGRRDARLNPRERRLVKWLAERDGEPRVTFQDHVDLHAGRRAPSVRSLQRDFQRLRARGLLRPDGDGFLLDTRPVVFGG